MKPKFIGWQEDNKGFPAFALYIADYGYGPTTTVARTLKRNKQEVPETPTYKEWKKTRTAGQVRFMKPSLTEMHYLDSLVVESRYREMKKTEKNTVKSLIY